MKKILLIVAILITLMTGTRSTASATSCENGGVVDKVGTLDQKQICDAVEKWAKLHIRVYVIYVTNANTSVFDSSGYNKFSDAIWAIETNEINQRKGGVLVPDYLGIAMTSDGTYIKVDNGDNVEKLPIRWRDFIDRLQGGLRTGGNQTRTIVENLNGIYVDPDAPKPDYSWMWYCFGGLVICFFLGMVGIYIYNSAKDRADAVEGKQEQEQHLREIIKRVNTLVEALQEILDANVPEETFLYQLWAKKGGEKSPEDKKFRKTIADAMTAFKYCTDSWLKLRGEGERIDNPTKELTFNQQVRQWESLYLLLLGGSAKMRNISNVKMKQILDLTEVANTDESDELVQKAKRLLESLQASEMKVELLFDHPDADKFGILGYVKHAKSMIASLPRTENS